MPKPDTTANPQVKPDPSLEKRTRRVFTSHYKLTILQQADAGQHGELGALLRREELYSIQLSQWRREFAGQGIESLSKSMPGTKASQTQEQKRIALLEKENLRLRQQLAVKVSCIDLHKKSWP